MTLAALRRKDWGGGLVFLQRDRYSGCCRGPCKHECDLYDHGNIQKWSEKIKTTLYQQGLGDPTAFYMSISLCPTSTPATDVPHVCVVLHGLSYLPHGFSYFFLSPNNLWQVLPHKGVASPLCIPLCPRLRELCLSCTFFVPCLLPGGRN